MEEPDARVLSAALEGVSVGVVVVAAGRVVYANGAATALIGARDGGEDARAWLRARLGSLDAVGNGALDTALAAPVDAPEARGETTPDGRTIGWVTRPGPDGTRVWTLCDLTTERGERTAIEAAAARVEDLYQHAPTGYHSLDREGRFVRVNDTECEWLGYTREEMLGQHFSRFVTPESVRTFDREFPGFVQRGWIRDLEFELVRKEGSSFPVLVSATALYDAHGQFDASRSVVTDITARKQAEEALRASEERYRRLYEATPMMLHSIDERGRLVAVSDCWLTTLGYTREEVLGRRSVEFMVPESRARAEHEVLPSFFRTGRCEDVPYQLVRRDGSVLDVVLSATCERGPDGRILRSLAVMTDVTARLRAEAELASYRAHLEELVEERTAALHEANQELEAFSYSVSHDLRGPLRAIEAFSTILAEQHANQLDPQGRDLLARIRVAVTRQARLIEDLLRLSRAGRAEMRREPVDLTAIARAVASDLAVAEPERRVQVRIEELPAANGDPALLRILFENVLGNAWKFTSGRPLAHIQVYADHTREGVVYRVKDDGAGFDVTRATRLFCPFERMHSQAEFPGTGIGLATVARVVKRHGGRVWLDSAVDRGTTVSFTLG